LFVVQDRRVPSWVGNGNRVLAAGERKAGRRKGQEEQGERAHTHARADLRRVAANMCAAASRQTRLPRKRKREDPQAWENSTGEERTPSAFESADKKPYSSSPASKTFPRVFDIVFHIPGIERAEHSTRNNSFQIEFTKKTIHISQK
jgi:hypothetical protein